MKIIEIETPIYETIQTGTTTEVKWETSDGKTFDNERSAEQYEFYYCKINQRGTNLPILDIRIFDFQCKEDLERYEKDYVYNGENKKYDKEKMVFPNTYVMWEECRYDDEDDDYYDYYSSSNNLYCETLDEYKERLIKAVNELK